MSEAPATAEEAVLAGVMVRNEAFHDVAPLVSSSPRTWGCFPILRR